METPKKVCNKCGKMFDIWDDQLDFSIHKVIGYGSAYDTSTLNLDLCCDCFDELIDSLIPKCKVVPVVSTDGE